MAAIPKVATRVQFRLYTGRYVEGTVRAILKTASGVKLQMEYGSGPYIARIDPEQIIQPEKPDTPKDVEF